MALRPLLVRKREGGRNSPGRANIPNPNPNPVPIPDPVLAPEKSGVRDERTQTHLSPPFRKSPAAPFDPQGRAYAQSRVGRQQAAQSPGMQKERGKLPGRNDVAYSDSHPPAKAYGLSHLDEA